MGKRKAIRSQPLMAERIGTNDPPRNERSGAAPGWSRFACCSFEPRTALACFPLCEVLV